MAQEIKVALVKRSTYIGNMEDSVAELVASLGGLDNFVKPGQSVLIKPNLLTDRTPDQHVTTHPEVVRAVIRLLKTRTDRISVGDSPASVTKLESVWEKTGFAALCRDEKIPLLNLEKHGSVQFAFANHAISIAKPFMEADVVINVPKVKTHVLTTLTCAVKNLYGAVPGYQKTNLHKHFPSRDDFGKLIAEIYRRTPLHLTIADGIVGMQGDGPSAGRPANLGFLAASSNAVALDLVVCRILGINPAKVPYLHELTALNGLSFEQIAISGARIEDIHIGQFEMPHTIPIPRWIVRLLGPFVWIRPAFDHKCIFCGKCASACPVTAITPPEKDILPRLNPKKCIGCCCCHEICPAKAITMTQSPLLNLVRRGRML